MKIPYLVASIMATTVVASPLAYCAPAQGTQVTHFRTVSNQAGGMWYDANNNVFSSFYAQVYDDMDDGVRKGIVNTLYYDSYQYMYIECSGPAYANVVSVSKTNGDSIIDATLDPSAPDCSSFSVGGLVTMSLTGKFDGNYRNSQNGTGKDTYVGTNSKYNFQSDNFSETFTGKSGPYSGTFTGNATAEHRTLRTQVE